jgi:hypothetical protein
VHICILLFGIIFLSLLDDNFAFHINKNKCRNKTVHCILLLDLNIVVPKV